MICRVKGTIKNISREIILNEKAIYNESLQTLTWQEKDDLSSTTTIDFKNGEIRRNNKELKMILTFAKKKVKILNCKLPGIPGIVALNVKILKHEVDKNRFLLTYETYLDNEKIDLITIALEYSKENSTN